MTAAGVVLRETFVSMAVNTVISIGFFLAVFGLGKPVPVAALGPDFLPQCFMVALMGCLIPAAILRRKAGAAIRDVVLRAFAIAAVALVVAGGGAWALTAAIGPVPIAAGAALAIKALFGALLAAATTPIAVRAALSPQTGYSA
ncbi:MAG: hypothetical protein PGN09_11340 [Sphingomonas fennica]